MVKEAEKKTLTDEEKLKTFEYYLNKMISPIKEFSEFCLLHIPEYFWVLPASTTQKNHGNGETLLNHILGCLYIAEKVCDYQFKDHWTDRQKSQLYSALLLHDSFRAGEPGREKRITQKMIDEKDLDQDLLGHLKTDKNHAEVGYRQLLNLSIRYNKWADENKVNRISGKNLDAILKAVRFHYGPFLQAEGAPKFSLDWPYSSVVIMCHNIDFQQCHNAMYFTRRKK